MTSRNQINKDPFEEQKILFDLEKARGFSTPSYNGTDIPDYYETTTFSPDELDQVFLKQNEFLNNNFFPIIQFFLYHRITKMITPIKQKVILIILNMW